MKTMFGLLALGGAALVLQGCGSGGSGGTSTTTTTTAAKVDQTTTTAAKGDTTTTTATMGTLPARTKPMSSQEAADYLNKLYTSFNVDDDSSSLGVTLTMVSQPETFFGNIFCSKVMNPNTQKYGGCWNGQADCRLSASVLNNQWMIKRDSKAIAAFGGRQIGYALNQTMVQSKWARCSYVWDGATNNLKNRGCGAGAISTTCDHDADSAFNNRCASDKHTCTPNDDEVKRALCEVAGGAVPVPPTHDGHQQCVFPGPAYGYTGQADYTPFKDYSHEMAKQRIKNNDGSDKEGDNLEKNNEVVVDLELLMKDVWENPMTAIPAILYINNGNAANTKMYKGFATKVRDDLCNAYGCQKNGGGDIPLVAVDIINYRAGGPFMADATDELTIAV